MPKGEIRLDYSEILSQLDALIAPKATTITRRYGELANASALLALHLKQVNWVGFYIVDTEDQLVLGPFQGGPACTPIDYGKGVCGTAWKEKRTIVVPNVADFVGHIVCDTQSQSEVVVPVFVEAEVVALLDVDSPVIDRFSPEDVAFLQAVAKMVSRLYSPS